MNAETKQPQTETVPDTEPKANLTPVPIWLILLFVLVAYGGMIYLSNNAGGFSPIVYRPYDGTNQLAIVQPPVAGEDPGVKRGKAVFSMAGCETCHSATGTGSTSTGCPPLDGSEWVIGGGPNRIIRIVLNGAAGPIDVKGGHYGGGAIQMTAVGAGLTDEQVSDVLTYVRQAWSNKGKGAGPVTPEQVKAIRALVKEHGLWNPADLLKIADKD